MDNILLFGACITLIFGGWISFSGLKRWRQRESPSTIESTSSPLTDFRWRPQLQTLAGVLMILWSLRIITLYLVQILSSSPGLTRENPTTGRIELLPTSNKSLDVMTHAVEKSTTTP